MSIIAILLISVSVSIDAFAVSVGGSLCDRKKRYFRNAAWAAFFFGGFQFFMPILGYWAATLLAEVVKNFDHWLAFGLLSFVGGNMIREAHSTESELPRDPECAKCAEKADFFSPRNLFVPAIATSIDALAVGAGLKFAGSSILFPAIAMGIATAFFSIVGVLIGNRLASLAGEKLMATIGGVAIILIGLKILLEHLMG